jgi:hypothetical protein
MAHCWPSTGARPTTCMPPPGHVTAFTLCTALHCRKTHLFDIDIPGKMTFRESLTLSPGPGPTVVDTEVRLSPGPRLREGWDALRCYAQKASHLPSVSHIVMTAVSGVGRRK